MGSLIVRQVDPSRFSRGPAGAKAGPAWQSFKRRRCPRGREDLHPTRNRSNALRGHAPPGPLPLGNVSSGLDRRPPLWRPPCRAGHASRVPCATVHRNEGPAGGRARRPPDRSTMLCPPAGGIQKDGSQRPVRNPGLRKKREERDLLAIPDSTEARTRLALRRPGLPLGRRGQSPRRPIDRRREKPDCAGKVLPQVPGVPTAGAAGLVDDA